jgi:LacI family transcriptional regulator, fructose operon transcriptional repressor
VPPQKKNSSRRTTIYDLAALAGASPSAVSAVLSGSWKKRRISAKTAERVMRLADEQGYSVNVQASLLRRERSNIVGMLVPKYDNRYFGEMVERFEAMARERELFPVITCTQRDPDLEISAAKELLSYQVGALIATGATDPDHISDLCSAAGVRSINLDLPGSKAPSVISDNRAGASALTGHILDRVGDRGPVVFVGGRATDHNTAARIAGFRDMHKLRRRPLSEGSIVACGYNPAKAEAALSQIDPTRIGGFFVNSTITLEGVVRWLERHAHGFATPVEYGCFDWDPFAAMLPGNIGMVRQDSAGMLDKVFALLDQENPAIETSLVNCVLELR